MRKLSIFCSAFILTSLFITSCSSDDDGSPGEEQQGDFENGFFVLNEGNTSPSTASISFISQNGEVTQDIYTLVNPGAEVTGSYLQSMFFDDTRVFIISGQANKITVVDRYTFEYITTISTDFASPRYGTVVNGKAFVTNYNDFATGDDDFLTVIDLADYSTTQVPLGNWSERITSENGKVYIANGYYGDGNSITVFNPANNSIETVIDLDAGNSPNSIEEQDGMLYVLTSNYGVPGKIFRINLSDNQINGELDIAENIPDPKQLQVEDGQLYFTSGTSVYKMALNSSTVPSTPFLTYESESEWGAMYGFNVEDGSIFISDAGDFTSNSKVYQYSTNGNLTGTLTVGIGPNGVYGNN